jgi:hypothetical protein
VEHALADLEVAVSGQGGAGVVVQARPVTEESGADVCTSQVDRAEAAAGSGGEPSKEVHAQAHLQAVGVQGGAGIVAQGRPGAIEVPADVGASEANRAVFAAAGGGEPVTEKHVLIDLQAMGDQGGAGIIAQIRPGAVEVAADVGATQVDHTLGNKRPLVFRVSSIAAKHVLAHGQPRRNERVTAGVAELGTIEEEAPADLRSRKPDLALRGETVAQNTVGALGADLGWAALRGFRR